MTLNGEVMVCIMGGSAGLMCVGVAISSMMEKRYAKVLAGKLNAINANLVHYKIQIKQESNRFVIYSAKRKTRSMSASDTKRLLKEMGENRDHVVDRFNENSDLITYPIDLMSS